MVFCLMRCSAFFWTAFIKWANWGLKYQTGGVCSVPLGAGAKKAAWQRVLGLRRKDCAGWLSSTPAPGFRVTGDCVWLAAEQAWDVSKEWWWGRNDEHLWCGCLVTPSSRNSRVQHCSSTFKAGAIVARPSSRMFVNVKGYRDDWYQGCGNKAC